jgi:hypothetical protein
MSSVGSGSDVEVDDVAIITAFEAGDEDTTSVVGMGCISGGVGRAETVVD